MAWKITWALAWDSLPEEKAKKMVLKLKTCTRNKMESQAIFQAETQAKIFSIELVSRSQTRWITLYKKSPAGSVPDYISDIVKTGQREKFDGSTYDAYEEDMAEVVFFFRGDT